LSPSRSWQVCGTADTGKEAVLQADKLRPDLVVMDISMPEMNGLEATRQIKAKHPEIKVLLFTMNQEIEWVENGFRCGANGYLLKSEADQELNRALETIESCKPYVSPGLDGVQVKNILKGIK
jgi:two-component system response regulator NreC